MATWNAPEEIVKGVKAVDLSDNDLEFYHDQMHIFWKKVEQGEWFDWTFREIHLMHKSTVTEMLKRKLNHIHPINNLDHIEFIKDVKELTKFINYVKPKR